MPGMAELLDDDAITSALADLPGWEREGDTIVRTASLPTFPDAISVVGEVADLAETHEHHPDIDIRYRTLTFRLSTHSEGGLTAKDTDLAGRISAVVDAR